MAIAFTPDLTREFILSRISEEEIFEAYGVRVQTGSFRSPLRKDLHPTCSLYRNKSGRLVMRDYSGHFYGDCFALVQFRKKCNYPESLTDVAKTFKILKGEPRHPVMSAVTIGPRTFCDLRLKSMPWDNQHLSWWEEYGITIDLLEQYNVVPVVRVWLNNFLYYNRDFTRKTEVVFGYKFGSLDYKIYFPQRTERRFLHNNPDILQGYTQLPESGDVVVITKALKDVICLAMFGIPAIAPMSETSMVSDSVLEDLKESFKHVYALYDRDKVGKIALLNLRSRGVKPLLMPKGTTKDFSDLCKKDYAAAQWLAQQFKESLDD